MRNNVLTSSSHAIEPDHVANQQAAISQQLIWYDRQLFLMAALTVALLGVALLGIGGVRRMFRARKS